MFNIFENYRAKTGIFRSPMGMGMKKNKSYLPRMKTTDEDDFGEVNMEMRNYILILVLFRLGIVSNCVCMFIKLSIYIESVMQKK